MSGKLDLEWEEVYDITEHLLGKYGIEIEDWVVLELFNEFKQRFKEAAADFLNELEDAFDHADLDDVVWYDDHTTLYEELISRFERIFGDVAEFSTGGKWVVKKERKKRNDR
ncbi:hypothetical protein DRN97_04445 [Methanosarcinales archaeon]|nr:MAG: hypothetical protein DRN97_04445 [Methanosarcinales archaeon]